MLVTCHISLLLREQPHLMVSCVVPGFINKEMTVRRGASKTPDQGTLPILHDVFELLEENGWTIITILPYY